MLTSEFPLHQHRGDVTQRSVAGDADIELAGICFGICLELLDILHRKRRLGGDDEGRFGDQHDRGKGLLRVERQVLVHQLVVRERPRRAEQYRVTVGGSFSDGCGADVAACAGAVVDDELLTKGVAEMLRERARQEVGPPAGGKRQDDGDGPRRPSLSKDDRWCRPEAGRSDSKRCSSSGASFHDVRP